MLSKLELGLRLLRLHPERHEKQIGPARARLLEAYRQSRLDVRGIDPRVFHLENVERLEESAHRPEPVEDQGLITVEA